MTSLDAEEVPRHVEHGAPPREPRARRRSPRPAPARVPAAPTRAWMVGGSSCRSVCDARNSPSGVAAAKADGRARGLEPVGVGTAGDRGVEGEHDVGRRAGSGADRRGRRDRPGEARRRPERVGQQVRDAAHGRHPRAATMREAASRVTNAPGVTEIDAGRGMTWCVWDRARRRCSGHGRSGGGAAGGHGQRDRHEHEHVRHGAGHRAGHGHRSPQVAIGARLDDRSVPGVDRVAHTLPHCRGSAQHGASRPAREAGLARRAARAVGCRRSTHDGAGAHSSTRPVCSSRESRRATAATRRPSRSRRAPRRPRRSTRVRRARGRDPPRPAAAAAAVRPPGCGRPCSSRSPSRPGSTGPS